MFDADNHDIAAECRLVAVHLDALKRKSLAFPDHVSNKAKSMAGFDNEIAA
jgi:hypothetical protein